MATEIVPLAPEHGAALREFAARVWRRPRSEAFYRWRYEVCADFHGAYLAMRDGRCLAMECAIRHPWRMGDRVVDILEVFDWYALPELRNAGLGVRVMQAFMRGPDPLLLVGGSQDTQTLLERLKWRTIATTERYALPLGSARLANALQERMRLPPVAARLAARAALARPGRRPRRRAVPSGGRTLYPARVGAEALALQAGPSAYGTVPLWTDAFLRWLTEGFPGVGHYLPLYFTIGEELVGWALLRVQPTPLGCDAELLECFAPAPDARRYTWMVSEAAVLAAAFGPGLLGAQTTCPLLAEGLRRNGFVRSGANPVRLWWPDGDEPPGPFAVGSNSGDTPFVPMAESWWDGAPDRRV